MYHYSRDMDYSVFDKEDVIKLGNNSIKKLKRMWLTLAIVAFSLVAIDIVSYIFLMNHKEMPIHVFIIAMVHLAGFGIFALIYYKVKEYEPLLEGCKCIERDIRSEIGNENRRNKRIAQKRAKRTRRNQVYTVTTSNFDARELYKYLTTGNNNQKVEYKSKEKEIAKTKEYTTGDHDFDSYFTNEEFDDLMD